MEVSRRRGRIAWPDLGVSQSVPKVEFGRRRGMNHQPYPSDTTDAQWSILEPLLPKPKPLGRPRKNGLRRVVDAIFYRNRNGCTWRALPHDFPPWRAVYNDFIRWRDDGTWAALRRPEDGNPPRT